LGLSGNLRRWRATGCPFLRLRHRPIGRTCARRAQPRRGGT
jgi:hypothetical protein